MKAPKDSPGATPEDLATLRAIWRAQARSLLALLETGLPLKAAERAVVTTFLRDQGINRETLERQGAAGALRGALSPELLFPTFNEPQRRSEL